jgi:hypothetical protein
MDKKTLEEIEEISKTLDKFIDKSPKSLESKSVTGLPPEVEQVSKGDKGRGL